MGNNAIVHKLELAIVDPSRRRPHSSRPTTYRPRRRRADAVDHRTWVDERLRAAQLAGGLSEAGAEGARLNPSPSPLGGGSGAERFKRVVETVVKRGRSNRGEAATGRRR